MRKKIDLDNCPPYRKETKEKNIKTGEKKKRKKKKKELKATSFPHLSQVNPDQIDECREAK